MVDQLERRHTLRKSQLIDFPNAAAGHEGVKASRSGDLIVKPCKNSEVRFYSQSWKPDPEPNEFAYYMPKFFGTLNLSENRPTTPLGPQGQAAQLIVTEQHHRPGTPNSSTSKGHGRTASRTVISHLPVDQSLAPTAPPKKWEPSGGQKIEAENSVVLENVASELFKPNILDVKIGSRLWADDAPTEKREKLDKVAAETTSSSLGFRIAGMKVWAGEGAYEHANRTAMDDRGKDKPNASKLDQHGLSTPSLRDDDYASYDRWYGRLMTAQTVKRGFEEFFIRPEATGVRKDHAQEVITRFIEDLKGLQEAMEHQETRMYSASLLLVYEGSGAALRQAFIAENRMLREARLRAEQESSGTSPSAPATASTSHLPILPRVDTGGDLAMPAPLMFDDSQMDEYESDEDESPKLPKIQSLKVIDFAHATYTPGQGPDQNFLTGLRNVTKILEEILADLDA